MSNWKNREPQKKYYTIYKITNLINGKIYIGFHSTNDLDDGYMGSGKGIKRAIKKYGEENFHKEILAIYDNQKDAEDLERELVNEDFVNRLDTYNMTIGGNVCILWGENNGFYGKHHTEDTIRNIQESRSWYYPTEETKEKIRQSCKEFWTEEERLKQGERLKGRAVSEETRNKLSESNKGKNVSEESKQKMSKSQKEWFESLTEEEYWKWYNRKYNEEFRNKLSELMKGRECPWVQITNRDPKKIKKTAETHRGMKRSEEARKNISESLKGNVPGNKNKVWCYNPNTDERKYVEEGNIPEGWVKGQNKKVTPKGKKWCHNPETGERKMCYENETPEGWIKGMGSKK